MRSPGSSKPAISPAAIVTVRSSATSNPAPTQQRRRQTGDRYANRTPHRTRMSARRHRQTIAHRLPFHRGYGGDDHRARGAVPVPDDPYRRRRRDGAPTRAERRHVPTRPAHTATHLRGAARPQPVIGPNTGPGPRCLPRRPDDRSYPPNLRRRQARSSSPAIAGPTFGDHRPLMGGAGNGAAAPYVKESSTAAVVPARSAAPFAWHTVSPIARSKPASPLSGADVATARTSVPGTDIRDTYPRKRPLDRVRPTAQRPGCSRADSRPGKSGRRSRPPGNNRHGRPRHRNPIRQQARTGYPSDDFSFMCAMSAPTRRGTTARRRFRGPALRVARHTTIAPSMAETIVDATSALSSGATPLTCSCDVTASVQRWKVRATASSSSGESMSTETVIASTGQPSPKSAATIRLA